MEQSPNVLNMIMEQMKIELMNDMKKKYKEYRINDNIESIINELLESDIDFSKINKKYKKPIKKMEIEDDPINYDRCMARRINGGYGGQCTRYKINGTRFCKNHQTEEGRWCGLITKKRQEICYLRGIHPHKWKN